MTCHLGDFAEYAGLAARDLRPRGGAVARGRGQPQRGGRRVAGEAAARRRHPGARRPPRRAGRSCSTPARTAAATDRAPRCSPPTGRCAGCRWSTSRRRSSRCTGCGSRRPSTPRNPAQRRDLASTLRNARIEDSPAATRPGAARGRRPPTTTSCSTCARACGRTPATAAPSARTTPAGPSATGGCVATPTPSSAGCATAPTRSRAPSTASPRLLDELGYLDGDAVTPDGRRLSVLYTELDLVAAECIRAGIWAGLAPAELAAVVSALVFESRQADDGIAPRLPNGIVRDRLAEMVQALGQPRGAGARRTGSRARASPTSASSGPRTGGAAGRAWTPCCGRRDMHGRRLRALDQAGHRPARPGRRRSPARRRRRGAGDRADGPGGRGPAAARRGRVLLGGLRRVGNGRRGRRSRRTGAVPAPRAQECRTAVRASRHSDSEPARSVHGTRLWSRAPRRMHGRARGRPVASPRRRFDLSAFDRRPAQAPACTASKAAQHAVERAVEAPALAELHEPVGVARGARDRVVVRREGRVRGDGDDHRRHGEVVARRLQLGAGAGRHRAVAGVEPPRAVPRGRRTW